MYSQGNQGATKDTDADERGSWDLGCFQTPQESNYSKYSEKVPSKGQGCPSVFKELVLRPRMISTPKGAPIPV